MEKRPHVRSVRVAPGTGNNRVRWVARASRDGRVSSSPARTPIRPRRCETAGDGCRVNGLLTVHSLELVRGAAAAAAARSRLSKRTVRRAEHAWVPPPLAKLPPAAAVVSRPPLPPSLPPSLHAGRLRRHLARSLSEPVGACEGTTLGACEGTTLGACEGAIVSPGRVGLAVLGGKRRRHAGRLRGNHAGLLPSLPPFPRSDTRVAG
jgi:hypothetical protein